MIPKDFVKQFFPKARPICEKYGIPTVLCLAQCALETGWGKSHPRNNYFGIKPWKKNQAASTQDTLEEEGGQLVKVRAEFVEFADFEGSVDGYCRFLKENPRYKKVFEHPFDWRKAAEVVCKAGYATDSKYFEKVSSVGKTIEKHVYELKLV